MAKKRFKNRSFFWCLLGSIFNWILVDFWYQNGAKLVSKWEQKSMLTLKGRFCKNTYKTNVISMIFEVSGVEVGSKNRSKIDAKMESKMECILASIFERFWWNFGAKLGGKNDQKLIQKGIEKTMQKRRAPRRPRRDPRDEPSRPTRQHLANKSASRGAWGEGRGGGYYYYM